MGRLRDFLRRLGGTSIRSPGKEADAVGGLAEAPPEPEAAREPVGQKALTWSSCLSSPYFQPRVALLVEGLDSELRWRIHEINCFTESQGREVVVRALGFACQAQGVSAIQFGRAALLAMPPEWLRSRVLPLARESLDLKDDWELRRFFEVLYELDRDLLRELAQEVAGEASGDLLETAQDALAWLEPGPA